MHISIMRKATIRSLEAVVFRVSPVFAAIIMACVPIAATAAGYLGNADQKAALLSPVPLGPPAALEQVPAEVPVVAKDDAPAPQAQPAAKQRRAVAAPRRPRTNPLDSFARDRRPQAKGQTTTRQTWPCTGGGICAWTTTR